MKWPFWHVGKQRHSQAAAPAPAPAVAEAKTARAFYYDETGTEESRGTERPGRDQS